MNTGVLERIRIREADVENNLDAVVQQLLLREDVTNKRHRLLIDHFVSQKIYDITVTADQLADLYLDEDDIVELREAPHEGREVVAQAMKEFDAKVADIRENRSSVARTLPPIRHVLPQPSVNALEAIFSPSELYGRCFYVEDNFQLFFQFMEQTMDLASRAKEEEEEEVDGDSGVGVLQKELSSWSSSWEPCPTYNVFVAQLRTLIQKDIPAHRKLLGFQLYKQWIRDLLAYLTHFYNRIAPLESAKQKQLDEDVEKNFAEYWSALEKERNIPWATDVGGGVEREGTSSEPSSESAHIHAKKCSGLVVPSTLRYHLEHFSLWPLGFISSVLQRAIGEEEGRGTSNERTEQDASLQYFPRNEAEVKEVCLDEGKVISLLQSLLFDAHQYTEKYLRRHQGKTVEEQEQERREAEESFLESFQTVRKNALNTVETTIAQAAQYHLDAQKDISLEDRMNNKNKGQGGVGDTALQNMNKTGTGDDGDDDDVRSGKELIGEDGKPIPRWLVHLQQLNKVFTCDVCGGTVYRGPKVFKEHFGGDRHAEGLRRIGVTEHLRTFEGLHSMKDVIALRDQLEITRTKTRKRLRHEQEMEEMQDPSGKVVTAGAYAQYQYRRI